MNTAVIGIGGVGGCFGGLLCQVLQSRDDLKIFFVARGRHLYEIQKNGLLLETKEGEMVCKPSSAIDTLADLPELDFCMLCVKSYDLDSVLLQLHDKISAKSTILPLLNGVDIHERIRHRIKTGVVYPSCVYISAYVKRDGKVTQQSKSGTIIFGKETHSDKADERIFDLFTHANIKYRWLDNPFSEIWSKFIFIASFSLVTANFNKTIGDVLASKDLSSAVKNIMREIENIARKKSIALPENITETAFDKGRQFPPETKTSFQRDYENMDKPDEREVFGGAIVSMAQQLGIEANTTREIYQSLQAKKAFYYP